MTLDQENFFVLKNQHNATKIELVTHGRFIAKLTRPRKVRSRADQKTDNVKILMDINA